MNFKKTKKLFKIDEKNRGEFFSLPELAKLGFKNINSLPISIRIVLESVLRNHDGEKIKNEHISNLADWKPKGKRINEIPFVVSRIVLQDFTGVPLLADLAAMRGVAKKMGKNPKIIEPLVPVDLVVDHSVQIDHFGNKKSLDLNSKLEFKRNNERYQFMKWGMQAFDTFKVVPPGIGIVHQVNLEYLSRGVHKRENLYYPDSLVGTDSHTTMINGIGVVGWGVGGIEAEAGMLGQPIYFLTPDVIGVNLTGSLRWGVTATDLVLKVTEELRKQNVVGKFVEFFGDGAEKLSVPDRATLANMAPEYGATMGFFPVDEKTVDFMRYTGKSSHEVSAFKNYFKAQNLFGIPKKGELRYTKTIEINLSNVEPSVAGPKRPQDRIQIGKIKTTFDSIFVKRSKDSGFGKNKIDLEKKFKTKKHIDINSSPSKVELHHGDILIAAITSCTNTSNPGVLVSAGILAKKAVERGLFVKKHIKTSLAPGSRVVTDYLKNANLLPYLEKLGFYVSAYGCTTCIGNAGPLDSKIEDSILKNDLVCAAILSGNRNFEARIHQNIKANFLASPPLVVAYAIAGNIRKNLMKEPLGQDKNGKDVFIGDIWPTEKEVNSLVKHATNANTFKKLYKNLSNVNPLWNTINSSKGEVYNWPNSTYIAEPPFFDNFSKKTINNYTKMRALGIFGDSVTTDHISPAGAIKDSTPAGKFLIKNSVDKNNFNSYGSRRGNHEIMMRGTFANVRIKNLILPKKSDGSIHEGGDTILFPDMKKMSIYDAAMKYLKRNVPTVIFGGAEYGTGSSRDWAAKGTKLLGVKAVIAKSFERIHRSNLIGMGVLPLQFIKNDSTESLKINGDEEFSLHGLENLSPQTTIKLDILRKNKKTVTIDLLLRIDTQIEVDYYHDGGILPYVLKDLLSAA